MNATEVDVWFVAEVLPLKGALERFLLAHRTPSDDVADLRQEVFVRVYEAGRKARPAALKAFVFMTARNLLRDRARRARVVSIETVADLDALRVDTEQIGIERILSAREELRRLNAALETLPPRCREVIMLRKIQELSQREVARRMGITENTVERQVAKGVRVLAARLFGHAEPKAAQLPPRAAEDMA